MSRFVLVHGGWQGGWCFRWLAHELKNRGHEVAAPYLTCEEVGLTPLDYAREVGPQPDAIVVGHSLAGLTRTSKPALACISRRSRHSNGT